MYKSFSKSRTKSIKDNVKNEEKYMEFETSFLFKPKFNVGDIVFNKELIDGGMIVPELILGYVIIKEDIYLVTNRNIKSEIDKSKLEMLNINHQNSFYSYADAFLTYENIDKEEKFDLKNIKSRIINDDFLLKKTKRCIMFTWVKRTNETTKKTLDKLEYCFSDLVFWWFNIVLVWFYFKIITNMLNIFIFIVEMILYIPLFIFFILPSIAVEIFKYCKRTKIKSE